MHADETEGKLQEEQLKLSIRGRMVRARLSGHNVQLFQPDLIAEQLKWILGVWGKK